MKKSYSKWGEKISLFKVGDLFSQECANCWWKFTEKENHFFSKKSEN